MVSISVLAWFVSTALGNVHGCWQFRQWKDYVNKTCASLNAFEHSHWMRRNRGRDGLGQGGVMRRKETKSWIAWRLAVSPCSHEDYSSATVDLLSTTLSTALNKLKKCTRKNRQAETSTLRVYLFTHILSLFHLPYAFSMLQHFSSKWFSHPKYQTLT